MLKKIQFIRSTRGPWLSIDWDSIPHELNYSRAQGDTLESIRSLVCAGTGCAFLPEPDVRSELEHGLVRRIELIRAKPIKRTICATYKKGRHLERSFASYSESLTKLLRHSA